VVKATFESIVTVKSLKVFIKIFDHASNRKRILFFFCSFNQHIKEYIKHNKKNHNQRLTVLLMLFL